MAAVAAGQDRNSLQVTGKTNQGGNTFCEAVEHKCSVNGSEVGSETEMEWNDERDEENEGKMGRMMHINQGKGSKRVRSVNEERSESEDDEIEGVQRVSPNKYKAIVRFNDKSQSDMK